MSRCLAFFNVRKCLTQAWARAEFTSNAALNEMDTAAVALNEVVGERRGAS